MRNRLALATVGIVATASAVAVPAGPAHACHDDIIISENPVHNWVCWTVHETGVEDRVEQHVQEIYCTITQDPACP